MAVSGLIMRAVEDEGSREVECDEREVVVRSCPHYGEDLYGETYSKACEVACLQCGAVLNR